MKRIAVPGNRDKLSMCRMSGCTLNPTDLPAVDVLEFRPYGPLFFLMPCRVEAREKVKLSLEVF